MPTEPDTEPQSQLDSLIQAPLFFLFLPLLLAECSEPAAKLNFPPLCVREPAKHCIVRVLN